jgi:hypothetical protein
MIKIALGFLLGYFATDIYVHAKPTAKQVVAYVHTNTQP